jgi:hypothetical protein
MSAPFEWRDGMLRVETCASSWIVDVMRSRFCRAERGTPATFLSPRAWQDFHGLAVGAGGHVRLALDAGGNSFVSGWLHRDGCERCAGQELLKPA